MVVLRSSIVITYYIKLFRTGADDILMTLLLLAAGMIKNSNSFSSNSFKKHHKGEIRKWS